MDHKNSHKIFFGLSVVLELKVKNWTKVGRPFSYSQIKDQKDWLWKSEFCCFGPSIVKRPKCQKNMPVFIVQCPCSLTTKLSCLQKNKWGHATQCNVDTAINNHVLCNYIQNKSRYLLPIQIESYHSILHKSIGRNISSHCPLNLSW